MKELILSHESALSYWRTAPPASKANYIGARHSQEALSHTPSMLSSADCGMLIERFGIDFLSQPLCLLVSDGAKRNRISGAGFRCMRTPAPNGSFASVRSYQVMQGEELYELLCVSPELCFVQMARLLEIYELVELGNELCGGYSLQNNPEGMKSRKDPFTSVANIESYIEAAKGVHGVKQARRALPYLVDNSWSPKESQVASMLVMPRRMGGFGIPKPIMNEKMHVSGEVARVLGGGKLIPDMYWPDISTVLEYDSNAKHGDLARMDHDARKRSAYRMLGLEVVTLTLGQLNDFATFAALADDLYKRFDKHRGETTAQQRAKQRCIHNWYLHGVRKAPVL